MIFLFLILLLIFGVGNGMFFFIIFLSIIVSEGGLLFFKFFDNDEGDWVLGNGVILDVKFCLFDDIIVFVFCCVIFNFVVFRVFFDWDDKFVFDFFFILEIMLDDVEEWGLCFMLFLCKGNLIFCFCFFGRGGRVNFWICCLIICNVVVIIGKFFVGDGFKEFFLDVVVKGIEVFVEDMVGYIDVIIGGEDVVVGEEVIGLVLIFLIWDNWGVVLGRWVLILEDCFVFLVCIKIVIVDFNLLLFLNKFMILFGIVIFFRDGVVELCLLVGFVVVVEFGIKGGSVGRFG